MSTPAPQGRPIHEWNNPLPVWLNTGFVIVIIVLLLGGVMPFMTGLSEFRIEAYIPSGAAFVAWIAIQLAMAVFTTGDLSTIFAVVLVLVGLGLFIVAILKPTVQFATEAAAALIGAGCGLPIGEHLRKNR